MKESLHLCDETAHHQAFVDLRKVAETIVQQVIASGRQFIQTVYDESSSPHERIMKVLDSEEATTLLQEEIKKEREKKSKEKSSSNVDEHMSDHHPVDLSADELDDDDADQFDTKPAVVSPPHSKRMSNVFNSYGGSAFETNWEQLQREKLPDKEEEEFETADRTSDSTKATAAAVSRKRSASITTAAKPPAVLKSKRSKTAREADLDLRSRMDTGKIQELEGKIQALKGKLKQTKGRLKQACATAKYLQTTHEESEAANAELEEQLKQKDLEIGHLKNLFIQNALRNLEEAKFLLTSDTEDDVLLSD